MAKPLIVHPEFPDAAKVKDKVLGHPKLGEKKGAKFSVIPVVTPSTPEDVAPSAAPIQAVTQAIIVS